MSRTTKEIEKARFERGSAASLVHAIEKRIPDLAEFHSLCPPEPDVLYLQGGARRIGIEVTQIVPGGPEQKKTEGAQERVIAQAERLGTQRGIVDIDVAVYFTYGYSPRGSRNELAERLVEFVQLNLPDIDTVREYDACDTPYRTLPDGIDHIRIFRRSGIGENWHIQRAGSPYLLSRELVRGALEKKQHCRAEYTEDYAEAWLLVCVGAGGPSTWAMSPIETDLAGFQTAFDRVFLHSTIMSSTLELAPDGRVRAI